MTKQADQLQDTCCEGCFGMTYIPELDRRFILCNNPRSDHYGHVLDSRHSCQEFGIQAPDDLEWNNPAAVRLNGPGPGGASMERLIKWSHEEAEKYRDLVKCDQPGRVINSIARLYMQAYRKQKRIEDFTDREIRTQNGVGPGILAEIRKVIPSPGGENVEKE